MVSGSCKSMPDMRRKGVPISRAHRISAFPYPSLVQQLTYYDRKDYSKMPSIPRPSPPTTCLSRTLPTRLWYGTYGSLTEVSRPPVSSVPSSGLLLTRTMMTRISVWLPAPISPPYSVFLLIVIFAALSSLCLVV